MKFIVNLLITNTLMYKEDSITLDDLKQGSESAFKQIYIENREKFINFGRRYSLSEDELVEVYQDTYIAFYDNIMSGKIKAFTNSISTYLFSIGKYLIFQKMKANKKTVNPDYDLQIVRDNEVDVTILDLDNEGLTEEQQLLYSNFDDLGKQCKELLTLFYYRGYTIKDILELGNYNSENVIKSAKSRCLKTLKNRIKATIIP